MATKKELELEAQLMQTRIELIRAQNIILNNDFSAANSRMKEIESELSGIGDVNNTPEINKEDIDNFIAKELASFDLSNFEQLKHALSVSKKTIEELNNIHGKFGGGCPGQSLSEWVDGLAKSNHLISTINYKNPEKSAINCAKGKYKPHSS